jgi:hypothetical protein
LREECAQLPKSNGMAVMESTITSRDTRFDLQLDSANKLAKINYTEEVVAVDVPNCMKKKEIKESPFIKYFELGVNNEDYWGYSHMVVLWEDCVDCLKVIYPHLDSSGHSRKRRGGLDVGQMN